MKSQIVLFVIFVLFTASCANNDNEVVVYTTVDQIFSEPILKAFEKETGIKVKAVYDTEETKSTGVLNRLLAEKNNPQCNVFWSGDPVRAIVLKNRGITEAYQAVGADDIGAVYKDSEGHWMGFSARARVLLFNKKLLKEGDVPNSIFDLTEEKYNGRVAIANPLFGTTTFHIAALFATIGADKTKQFLVDLKKNKVVIASSNGDVKKRVMSGEVACGLTDTDDAYEALKEDAGVGVVFLDQRGIGSLIMPNTVSLIKNSKHPTNAKLLIDYLISRKTEENLAKSCAQMPLHKGVKTPKGIPSLDNIIPMELDYEQASKQLELIQNYLKEWVEQ